MKLLVEVVNGISVFRLLEERLSIQNYKEFKEFVLNYIDKQKCLILIDLGNVNFIDSSGLGAFVSIAKKVNYQGEVAFINISKKIKSLLNLTKLDKIFRVFKNLDEVIASFSWYLDFQNEKVEYSCTNGICIIDILSSKFSYKISNDVNSIINKVSSQNINKLIIDFQNIEQIDFKGLSNIISNEQLFEDKNNLAICSINQKLKNIIFELGLNNIIKIFSDKKNAFNFLQTNIKLTK